jgi:hypothetical protein
MGVAVVDQIDKDADVMSQPCSKPEDSCGESDPNESNQVLCKYKNQIDFYTMKAQFAMWPVFAKHLGNRMYPSEYSAMHMSILYWIGIRFVYFKQWKTECQ